MKYLFLSQYYPEQLLPHFIQHSKCGLDFAAHNLSIAIIQGFKDNAVPLDIINTPHLGSYPKLYDQLHVPAYNEHNLISIGYNNIMLYKRKSIDRNALAEVKKWCQNNPGAKTILFYSFALLGIAPEIRKYFPDVQLQLIVTDLQEFMASSNDVRTRITNKILKTFSLSSSNCYAPFDGYVLLAEAMKERLPMNGKRYVHIEGIYNNEYEPMTTEKDSNKVIMYTGNLGSRYGIVKLLDAFKQINDPDYRLWIRGNGELENYIKEMTTQDNRITLFEKKMSREDLVSLQMRATILINPVSPKEEFTRFFFPSKTLEYLASGTPTVMYHLDCIPSEYNEHIFYIKGESAEDLKNSIINICERPQKELREFGKSAKQFILSFKTPKVQINKLITYINE